MAIAPGQHAFEGLEVRMHAEQPHATLGAVEHMINQAALIGPKRPGASPQYNQQPAGFQVMSSREEAR